MNGVSRHIACVSCRDRKVRCNGEQPACEKCRQAGEKCVYLPTARPSKADLAQKVETLQQRLERAEAYIRKMETEANCSRATSYFSPTAISPVSLSGTPIPPLPLPNPGFATPPTPATFAAGLYHPQPEAQFPEMPGPDLLYTAPILDPHGLLGAMDGASLESQAEDTERPLELDHARKSSSISIPSLREIRELNSALSSSARPPSAPVPGMGPHASDRTGRECEGCSALTAELAAYCLTVSSAHCDIAGISLALAEYLAWMRKAANLKTTDLVGMLETLECRAREVHDMAETRPWTALKNMVTALKPLSRSTYHARLCELEESLGKQSAEAGQFFHAEYDIRMALPCQRKLPIAEPGLPVALPTPSDAPDGRLDTQT